MNKSGRNAYTGGGSATIPEEVEAYKPKKFELKEKVREMLQYGMPAVNKFPRRDRCLADTLRECMTEMMKLSIRLEKKYYKKTTLEDLDIQLETLREFIVISSSKEYYGDKFAPPMAIHTRETWSRFNDEIGRMIGGYKKYVEGKQTLPHKGMD